MSKPTPELHTYVSECHSAKIVVKVVSSHDITLLTSLGFYTDTDIAANAFICHVKNDMERSIILQKLRDHDMCFSAGKEWNPSEMFEYLRDEGLVTGTYRRITWMGPGQLFINEGC